jgi:hypothetical protein
MKTFTFDPPPPSADPADDMQEKINHTVNVLLEQAHRAWTAHPERRRTGVRIALDRCCVNADGDELNRAFPAPETVWKAFAEKLPPRVILRVGEGFNAIEQEATLTWRE